jgi:hypothetical protein
MSFSKAARQGLVLSTMILLASCSSSTSRLVRPNLPAPPPTFGKPVDLPSAHKGMSVKRFALENRAAAIQANNRLENDAAFYSDVFREFGNQE